MYVLVTCFILNTGETKSVDKSTWIQKSSDKKSGKRKTEEGNGIGTKLFKWCSGLAFHFKCQQATKEPRNKRKSFWFMFALLTFPTSNALPTLTRHNALNFFYVTTSILSPLKLRIRYWRIEDMKMRVWMSYRLLHYLSYERYLLPKQIWSFQSFSGPKWPSSLLFSRRIKKRHITSCSSLRSWRSVFLTNFPLILPVANNCLHDTLI